MKWFAAPLLALLAANPGFSWSTGSAETGVPVRPRPPRSEALLVTGARVYDQRCAPCHGGKGDGRGPSAASLPVAPRDFTKGVFKLRSTPTGSIPTDQDLFGTISRGMHGTPMMAWRGLPEDERWAVVERLKSFSVRFAQEEPEPAVVVPAEPRVDAALLADGARLWQGARCAACHGNGDGRGPGLGLLQKDPGRRVRVRDLQRGEFLRGNSARDIYLTLRTGMDGTPMGSYAQAFSERETWALAEYVRSLIVPRQ